MKPRDSKELTATSLEHVLEVRRLLYLTEFLVLINYVGIFIPLIFCTCRSSAVVVSGRSTHVVIVCICSDLHGGHVQLAQPNVLRSTGRPDAR
jgi:hypothetical protein